MRHRIVLLLPQLYEYVLFYPAFRSLRSLHTGLFNAAATAAKLLTVRSLVALYRILRSTEYLGVETQKQYFAQGDRRNNTNTHGAVYDDVLNWTSFACHLNYAV